MKKSLMMLFALALSAGMMAQGPEKKKEEMKDLKKDVQAKRVEKKEMGHALVHGKFEKAVDERKDVRKQKRHIHRDAARLKKQGVKHPVAKVNHQIHEDKEKKEEKKP